MPAAKQYVVVIGAAADSVRITPAGVARIGISIQNTGLNPCLYRWDNAVQQDGGDMELAVNEKHDFLFPATCPQQALNFFSTLGTTVAVIEILEA
jgi:hypothetical protein